MQKEEVLEQKNCLVELFHEMNVDLRDYTKDMLQNANPSKTNTYQPFIRRCIEKLLKIAN